jgi:LEA14-like dessication related protein
MIAAVACSKPEPPVLTPERAGVKSIGPTGIDFVVTMRAKNPNRMDLNIQAVTAKVTINGSVDLGTTTISSPIALPAGAETPLNVPVSFQWTNLPAIARLGATRRDVPYKLEGNVTVGGSTLSVTLPFTMTGIIKHEDLAKAAINSLPAQLRGLIPDLNKPLELPR